MLKLTVLNSNQTGCVHLVLLYIVASSHVQVYCVLDHINNIVCMFILFILFYLILF